MNWAWIFSKEGFLLIFSLLGGLALFLFGMQTMTAGLVGLAGQGMRSLIHRATRNRVTGLGLGSGLGFLVQSSAATVMLVGFVNAGLITLPQAVPVIFGANVGTTLSMQLISFKISEYSLFAIAVGFLGSMLLRGEKKKAGCKAFLGFGLLFLGMSTMSDAVAPYRDTLAPFLAVVDGTHWRGALMGVGIAAGITAVIQSSGATIGMVFALIHAGAITSLPGAYPIVIGAGIGTCVTALLGSIGTSIQARRTAVSHLVFNLFSVAVGLAISPWIYKWMGAIPGDLVHQAANANMMRMVLSALLLLPVAGFYAKGVVWITPSKKAMPDGSFLDDELLTHPEQAISACVRELRRAAILTKRSMLLHAELFRSVDRKTVRAIIRNEEVVNEIKVEMESYVKKLTRQRLSKRQAVMIQHVNRCMSNLERIGDHVDRLREITVVRLTGRQVLFEEDLLAEWFQLYGSALKVLRLTIHSLDPELKKFQKMARSILEARDDYMKSSLDFRSHYNDRLAGKEGTMSPEAGIYLTKYVDALDRIVKHSKTIALLEGHSEFWIKRKKLKRVAGAAPEYAKPELVDVTDYLDRLQSENESI
ncbi:Na/Pi symporter [Kiritimatiellaeota bacterium B1221]|nr:Na/Pi symporter [Kiritimatiellaeota bacterium B1221]